MYDLGFMIGFGLFGLSVAISASACSIAMAIRALTEELKKQEQSR